MTLTTPLFKGDLSSVRWDLIYSNCTTLAASRSRDMVGANQNLNGLCDLTRPFQGWFVNCRLALAMIKLSTKFEVYISTHCEDMEGDTKCGKLGWFGVFRVTENSAIRYRVQTSSY